MKIKRPKFKKGDEVIVDDWMKAEIADVGLFKNKNTKKVSWRYQLTKNLLPGFWADENRIKTRD